DLGIEKPTPIRGDPTRFGIAGLPQLANNTDLRKAQAISTECRRGLSHRRKFSSVQMLPETSAMLNNSRSWVSEKPTGDMKEGIMNLGRAKEVTRCGAPIGVPVVGSKGLAHTLKYPSS